MNTLAYGPSPHQVGDLYVPPTHVPDTPGGFPRGARPPVVCLLHGGYWRMPWGRDHIAPLALPLTRLGFAVWNLDYRCVGATGGGWPGTFQDVGAGIDYLASLEGRLDLTRLILVGHSAGGHLALWAAGRGACTGRGGEPGGNLGPQRVRAVAAVGLAPVADLLWAYEHGCGNGAVAGLMGGSPRDFPERYRQASPAERLPLGVRQLVLHGTPDEDVPVAISRRYAKAAVAAGDDFDFVELPHTSHMDFVDPASSASSILFDWLFEWARSSIG